MPAADRLGGWLVSCGWSFLRVAPPLYRADALCRLPSLAPSALTSCLGRHSKGASRTCAAPLRGTPQRARRGYAEGANHERAASFPFPDACAHCVSRCQPHSRRRGARQEVAPARRGAAAPRDSAVCASCRNPQVPLFAALLEPPMQLSAQLTHPGAVTPVAAAFGPERVHLSYAADLNPRPWRIAHEGCPRRRTRRAEPALHRTGAGQLLHRHAALDRHAPARRPLGFALLAASSQATCRCRLTVSAGRFSSQLPQALSQQPTDP